MGSFKMWGTSCSYPDILCNQICFKIEYLIIVIFVYVLPTFIRLVKLDKLLKYFIKHWLLSIIFGLRTALVVIRPIIVYLVPEQDRKGVAINPSGNKEYWMDKNKIIRPKKRIKRRKKSDTNTNEKENVNEKVIRSGKLPGNSNGSK